MKFGLFLTLVVLLASTHVFGQPDGRTGSTRIRVGGRQTSTLEPETAENHHVTSDFDDGTEGEQHAEEPIKQTFVPDARDQDKVLVNEGRPSALNRNKVQVNVTAGDDGRQEVQVNVGTKEGHNKGNGKDKFVQQSGEHLPEEHEEQVVEYHKPGTHTDGSTKQVNIKVEGDRKPEGLFKKERPEESETVLVNEGKPQRPEVEVSQLSDKMVLVSGNIVLVKYRSSVVDPIQYDIDGTRPIPPSQTSVQSRTTYAQDFISRNSRVILYVSTTKTTDPKLSFAQFPIKYREDHFPLSFDINVELPNQQRGLLQRADITLYFFVYVTNLDTRIDTFIPAGTSQILLQGTNRLVQKLDIYVRASGIEIDGLFRGRFGHRYIRPGTSFQVYIVPEQSLILLNSQTFDFVAQLTITNVPAMFPVPFSLLVQNQMLKPDIKYYAIAFVYENGYRRAIHQEPIWVINEQKVLVTSQVVFTVVPSPFILRGTVTRAMPGSFFLQPHSSLILRLHEIGSDSRDVIFKLPEIVTLPQIFQVNISQSLRFDPSKNYDIRALITDERNNIYMASLQPIPLLDEFSKLIVPVDDLLYYVQVRLHSSSNQLLNYMPGSTAQIFVTESPESPTKPIVSMRIGSVDKDFRDFSIQVPATAIQRNRNYYLVMMIETNGVITHVSKTLLISNNQPPPLILQLPVLSLNLISGVIFDVENRPAQWSSSSYANLFLLDDKASDPDKAIVQVWKIHLENDFPVRFEIQLDFSRLFPDRVYRLQAAIENGRNLLEYKPAGSVLVFNPAGGIVTDVRIPVNNVKTFQSVRGLIYINDINVPLPEKSEIIVQLSSSPSLLNPSIVDEIRLQVQGQKLPIEFTMKLPLNKIDINAVYYFLVRYIVRDTLVIPSTQAFAFSPRNEATVVLTLSKTPQIPITGQVTSTGSPLNLPPDSTLHLYVTDNMNNDKPIIYSEAFLQATANSLYEFTMNIDSVILQKKIPLYLRADILYQDRIILSMPRPALLQISPGGEWNINLVIDLPTLLIGRIISLNRQKAVGGEFDVHIQIFERGANNIVYTARLRLGADLPKDFRIELDNELFVRYRALQARAVIKNCKEQILFESGGSVNIQIGLNVQVDLPVVLTDPKKFTELQKNVDDLASFHIGVWRLSVTGVANDIKTSLTGDDFKPGFLAGSRGDTTNVVIGHGDNSDYVGGHGGKTDVVIGQGDKSDYVVGHDDKTEFVGDIDKNNNKNGKTKVSVTVS